MTQGFIKHWENVVDNEPGSPAYPLAKLMVDLRKIVFSHTQSDIKGRNLEVENGELVAAVNKLKAQPGKDILVYGGADFATSLVSANLIDEYYIIRNPVAIGGGISIFKEKKILKLDSSISFRNGKILEKYLPV